MRYTQEDLELIARHVAQAEKNLLQQQAIVSELRAADYPVSEAMATLDGLEIALSTLRQRQARIRAEVAELSESVS
jgi:hypothetical protein